MSTSIQYDAMTGAQTVIRELDLTGVTGATPLPDGRVYLRKLPSDINLTKPCVIVSLGPVAETEARGPNAEDDWGYPVLVTIVIAANQDLRDGWHRGDHDAERGEECKEKPARADSR